jgi:hypothetical protein
MIIKMPNPIAMKRRTVCCIVLALFVFTSYAQVKIGDNPNSINPNSLLELESSNKGLLAPRTALNDVNSISPLTSPVPAGMIVYSSGGIVADGFYFWNGAKWLAVQSTANTRSNYVLVKSVADLPAPIGDVITLKPGTTYEVNGTLLLDKKINLNGCYLVGMDATNDKIIYTPASGELFTGTKGGSIKTLTLVAGSAQLFNLNLEATETLLVRDAIIAKCKNVGLVKGGYNCFFSVINFSDNLSGITFQDNNYLLLDNTAWFANNKGTFEKLEGSFGVIEKLGGFSHALAANSGLALDITGITSITEAANLKNTAFMGTGTKVNGTFSKQWEVEAAGINTEKDAVASGNIYLTSSTTTTFEGEDKPTKVLGTTIAADLYRVSSPMNNRLVYEGTKTRRFSITASLSVTSQAANKYFSFYVYKNGVKLPESEQAMRLSTGVDKGSITLSCTVVMAPNDYIEIWAANTSDATAMTVETFNLSIR